MKQLILFPELTVGFGGPDFNEGLCGNGEYGYATERVRVLSIDDIDCLDEDDDGLYFADDVDELEQKLINLFGFWKDLHPGNVGWDINGNIVAIDFGDCSTDD